MSSGIYCIENLINGKKYVGQGLNVKKRMIKEHENSCALNGAIKKYGKENFKRYVLVYCEEWELERLEKKCIKIFRSHTSEWGYNISWGGIAPMAGRKHSDETIQLMSGENNPNYGKPMSSEQKKKISESKLGKPLSEKTKKMMSETRIGMSHSEETKKRMSESSSGENNSMYGILGKDNPNYGSKRSDESKELMSKIRLGIGLSEETKKRMSESKMGEKNSNFGKKFPNATSLFYGVSKKSYKKRVVWQSEAGKKYLGVFETELEAAMAHDKYVIENGLLYPLNFPENNIF